VARGGHGGRWPWRLEEGCRGRAALGGVAMVGSGRGGAGRGDREGGGHGRCGAAARPILTVAKVRSHLELLLHRRDFLARQRWRCNARRTVSSQSREANGRVVPYASPDCARPLSAPYHCSVRECSGHHSGQRCSHFLTPDLPNVWLCT
jgi:hypothetical protein